LADELDDVAAGAAILNEMLQRVDRRAQWIDLIRRLQDCGSIERPGAGDELIAALDE